MPPPARISLLIKETFLVLGAAAMLLALLPGGLSAAPADEAGSVPPAKKSLYLCEDGKKFTLELIKPADCVILTLEGKPIKLTRVASGSGAKYSNGKTTVWLKGKEAFIEIDGKIIIKNCRSQD